MILAHGGGLSTKVDLSFHPHVDVILATAAVAAVLYGLQRRGATRRQRAWAATGLGFFFIFAYWPIHDIGEQYLLLVHMIQHTVFTLVIPACFLLAIPVGTMRWMIDRPVVRQVVRVVCHPVVALVLFNALLAGTHWVNIVEYSLRSEWFHFSVHVTLFAAALCMWFPVINRVEGFPQLSTPVKVFYLFAQSLVPTIPASFLTFANKALYPTYGRALRLIRGLDPVGDQQIAAAIMKLGAGAFLWSVMGYFFIQWWSETKAGTAGDNRRVAAPRPMIPVRPVMTAEPVLTYDEVQAAFEAHPAPREPNPVE